MTELARDFARNTAALDQMLGVERNYDMITRPLRIGRRQARLWVVDGYGEDSVLERMAAFWLSLPEQRVEQAESIQQLIELCMSFDEIDPENQMETIATNVLLGKTALLVEGFDQCLLIDAKSYPMRSVEEPSDGRVLRGSHDGFVEVMVKNTALLRRRIRDPHLTMEGHQVGDRSHTDVVLCYMDNLVDPELLDQLREKLRKIDVHSLAMSQESVAEAIMAPQWYNPFPKVRYTERPDKATACVMEGDIVLLVDNSPAVMLLPTRFFDFVQETNDYYFPPLVGNYLRLIRAVMMLLSLVITPVWYLLVTDPQIQSSSLEFLAVEGEYYVPLLLQLLVVEWIVDVLKLASLNTPNVLSNSFSMLGALILGDFAVQARWLVPEVLVYMAFVAVANFVQPSFELGYALKLLRMTVLLLSAALDWWGFAIGIIGCAVLLLTTKPVLGKHYLYPLIPFDGKELGKLLFRRPIHRDNT